VGVLQVSGGPGVGKNSQESASASAKKGLMRPFSRMSPKIAFYIGISPLSAERIRRGGVDLMSAGYYGRITSVVYEKIWHEAFERSVE